MGPFPSFSLRPIRFASSCWLCCSFLLSCFLLTAKDRNSRPQLCFAFHINIDIIALWFPFIAWLFLALRHRVVATTTVVLLASHLISSCWSYSLPVTRYPWSGSGLVIISLKLTRNSNKRISLYSDIALCFAKSRQILYEFGGETRAVPLISLSHIVC